MSTENKTLIQPDEVMSAAKDTYGIMSELHEEGTDESAIAAIEAMGYDYGVVVEILRRMPQPLGVGFVAGLLVGAQLARQED